MEEIDIEIDRSKSGWLRLRSRPHSVAIWAKRGFQATPLLRPSRPSAFAGRMGDALAPSESEYEVTISGCLTFDLRAPRPGGAPRGPERVEVSNCMIPAEVRLTTFDQEEDDGDEPEGELREKAGDEPYTEEVDRVEVSTSVADPKTLLSPMPPTPPPPVVVVRSSSSRTLLRPIMPPPIIVKARPNARPVVKRARLQQPIETWPQTMSQDKGKGKDDDTDKGQDKGKGQYNDADKGQNKGTGHDKGKGHDGDGKGQNKGTGHDKGKGHDGDGKGQTRARARTKARAMTTATARARTRAKALTGTTLMSGRSDVGPL